MRKSLTPAVRPNILPAKPDARMLRAMEQRRAGDRERRQRLQDDPPIPFWVVMHHRIRVFGRFVISRFPIPTEVKWQELVYAIGMLIQCYLKEMDRSKPVSRQAERTFSRALYQTGKQWPLGLPRRNNQDMSAKEIREIYHRLFRVLDIESSTGMAGKGIIMVNYHCPFLEHAEAEDVGGRRLCEYFCGSQNSFMRGVADGFPFLTEYQAGAMMGKGDNVCTKRIQRLR